MSRRVRAARALLLALAALLAACDRGAPRPADPRTPITDHAPQPPADRR